jgi:hypothetical protein
MYTFLILSEAVHTARITSFHTFNDQLTYIEIYKAKFEGTIFTDRPIFRLIYRKKYISCKL